MPRRSPPNRKRRTREPVIADLAINHVERQVLLSGNTVERKVHDYGTDLVLSMFNEDGEPEPGVMSIQVKASDHLGLLRGGLFVACRIERAHLRAWLAEPMPLFLIVYDVPKDRAYWLYIQATFGGVRRFGSLRGSKRLTARIPTAQVLDPEAVRQFRSFHQEVMDQIRGVVFPHD